MFHVALTAILFVALLMWDLRLRSEDPDTVRRADRWLVSAAFVYGVAVANHSLALLLPPAIGLFVLVADWRVIFRPRTIVACVAVLVGTMAVLFSELPIRAAMNAPLVYGHPDTWSGFQYVVLAEQFRGSLSDPFGDLPAKAGQVLDLFTGWLGPLAMVAALGVVTSLIRRPRYLILSGLSAVVTCGFAASYANADIQRYYLLPLLIVFTWIGLAAADVVALIGWVAAEVRQRATRRRRGAWIRPPNRAMTRGRATRRRQGRRPSGLAIDGTPALSPRLGTGLAGWAVIAGEIVVAAAIVFSAVNVVPARQLPQSGTNPGGVSQANDTSDAAWLKAVLAPASAGGLPAELGDHELVERVHHALVRPASPGHAARHNHHRRQHPRGRQPGHGSGCVQLLPG